MTVYNSRDWTFEVSYSPTDPPDEEHDWHFAALIPAHGEGRDYSSERTLWARRLTEEERHV